MLEILKLRFDVRMPIRAHFSTMNWNQLVQQVSPYIFKIETPSGHGTGFLCGYNETKEWCAVATAHHVISTAHEWQQPIRATHYASNTYAFLKEGERAIHIDHATDSAVLIFPKTNIPLPENLVPLLPIESPVSIGEEVGWLGFPAIEPYTLCFFSGNVSARRDDRKAYLIDGVAINGVSGGPVIYNHPDGVQIVGSVNAYRANRTYGDTLPGLLIAQDVSHFHGVIQHIRSIDEASKNAQSAQQQDAPSQGSGPESSEHSITLEKTEFDVIPNLKPPKKK